MSAANRQQLRERYGEEQVLVTDAAELWQLPSGVSRITDLKALLAMSSYRPRWQVEYDPAWRQFVCYIVVRQQQRLFLTERLPSQGETRLHSLLSIGVGGHLNLQDGSNPLASGWRRELAEELLLDWTPGQTAPLALINDLSNEVSRDHLGVLYLLEVPPSGTVAIRETEKMRGSFQDIQLIATRYYSQLESWSQLTIDFLQKAPQ